MQTAALLQKPMHLGEGFEDIYDWWSSGGDTVGTIFTANPVVDYDFLQSQSLSGDIQPVYIDTEGNASTASGQQIITANTLSQIATANPGRESVAVAQSLQVTNPEWTKQFKTTDDLVRAAAGLFSTVKAVLTGQPIPRTQSPYVYGPGQSPGYMQQTGLTTTHMLLIGGAALAAILLLRRK